MSASTFVLYHFKFVPKIATYVEQRFDKKLVTDANNHLDPLECVDIKCRRYVRPDSRVTDQTDIPFPRLRGVLKVQSFAQQYPIILTFLNPAIAKLTTKVFLLGEFTKSILLLQNDNL